jgi:hypothetical protein
VYEAKLVHRFYRKRNLGHVEAGNVLGEDLVLDEHSHQITTWQELHEHVEEGVVLKGRVQLDNPRAVRLGEDITFRSDVSQLVFFELGMVSKIRACGMGPS